MREQSRGVAAVVVGFRWESVLAERYTAEWLENVREGTARGLRSWKLGLAALPALYRAWVTGGKFKLADPLRPVVAGAVRTIGEIVDEHGGAQALTPRHLVHVRCLFLAIVGFDSHLGAYLETGDLAHLAQAKGFANEKRNALRALGVDRAEGSTELDDYAAALLDAEASARRDDSAPSASRDRAPGAALDDEKAGS